MIIQNRERTFRELWKNHTPYTNQDYVRDAITVIDNRIKLNGYIQTNDRDIGKAYASRWSGLTQKSGCGFRIRLVYYIASKEKLDLTATLGNKLLRGLFGRGIDTTLANHAFSTNGRKASDTSADFAKLDLIIEKYQEWALMKLKQHKYRLNCNRDLAHEMYQRQVEAKKLENGGVVKNASPQVKTRNTA